MLDEAIADYVAGRKTAAEVIALLPPVQTGVVVRPRTLEDIESDPDPRGRFEEGTWDEITLAHERGKISDEQYAELWSASTGRPA